MHTYEYIFNIVMLFNYSYVIFLFQNYLLFKYVVV